MFHAQRCKFKSDFQLAFGPLEKKLWKLEFVVFRIDWWILWTCYYEDFKVIQISREITEVWKFKCGFFRKILALLWMPYIIGDWIAAFFNSFCQNLPCGTNQDQSLCSRTWLNANDCLMFTYCIVKCFITQTKQSSN